MDEYIYKDEAIAIIENKQREICQMGRYSRADVYGSDREAFDNWQEILDEIEALPLADVAPVRHGRWILEAHDEMVNFRWNVTAECSECCDERKEIWAGFFPNIDPSIAKSVALASAKSVKLSNYCTNCGAKMN